MLYPTQARSFPEELLTIENIIENVVGTRVIWSYGDRACKEGLYGFYRPDKDLILMCQENHNGDYLELVSTLKHEGWHAVQQKCNINRAALTDAQIIPNLKDRDRINLHTYHPTQTRAEAEARVVEQIPTEGWIRGVKSYCRSR